MANPFAALPPSVMDDIMTTNDECRQDKRPDKIDIVVGAYRDANGKPYILPSVYEAEKRLLEMLKNGTRNKEYVQPEGFVPFNEAAVKLLLGADCPPMNTIAAFNVLSGTGAVRVAASIFRAVAPGIATAYCSAETWPNHFPVMMQSGFEKCVSYPYFNLKTRKADFPAFKKFMLKAAPGSVVILHGAGHNPTGSDFSAAEWDEVAAMAKKGQWFVILDSAYQGYASGDLEKDAYGARAMIRAKVFTACCQSFAKNMGLYGDRCGCLSVFAHDGPKTAKLIFDYTKARIIRPMYSSPPINGYRIAHILMTDPVLRPQWEKELKAMSDRILRIRKIVFDELTRLQTPGTWNHIVEQIGMFSYVCISPAQVQAMKDRHGVFMLPESRISIAGLTDTTAVRFARALDDVVRNPPKAASKL